MLTWNLGGSFHHSVTCVFRMLAQPASCGWCQVLLSVPAEPGPAWATAIAALGYFTGPSGGGGVPHSSVLRSTQPAKPLKPIYMTAFPILSGLADLVATPEAAFPGSRYKHHGFSVNLPGVNSATLLNWTMACTAFLAKFVNLPKLSTLPFTLFEIRSHCVMQVVSLQILLLQPFIPDFCKLLFFF